MAIYSICPCAWPVSARKGLGVWEFLLYCQCSGAASDPPMSPKETDDEFGETRVVCAQMQRWVLCVPNNQEEALSGALKILVLGFPDGSVVKNPPANAGDAGSSVVGMPSFLLMSL